MADSTTTHYAFVQPQVGASLNTWGTKLNNDLASLDSLLWTISAGINQGVNTQSSAASITLTNPLVTVQKITFTAGSQKLVFPAMNAATSAQAGAQIRIINAGGQDFSIVCTDTSTIILNTLTAGTECWIAVMSNATANGTFDVAGPFQPFQGGSTSSGAFVPTGSAVPTNGLYLPAANTPGIAANSKLVTEFITSGTAVNFFTLTNAATGVAPIFAVAGSDSNIGMTIATKGTGNFLLQSNGNFQFQRTADSSVQFQVNTTATAVDFLVVSGATTANPATLAVTATGSDTNININLVPKGTGVLQVAGVSLTSLVTAVKSVKTQVFTSSGTYTPNAGMIYCWVRVQGAGASGASVTGGDGAGGGGAGGYAESLLAASDIGASKAVTINAAGSGVSGNTNGNDGGSTTLGALITCNGGVHAISAAGTRTAGGVGGTASGGNIVNCTGQSGGPSGVENFNIGGWGGSTPFGAGGYRQAANAGGQDALGYGAGGSGSANGTSGAGKNGIVIIVEFCTQ